MAKLFQAARAAVPFGVVALGALLIHEVAMAETIGLGIAALLGSAAALDIRAASRARR